MQIFQQNDPILMRFVLCKPTPTPSISVVFSVDNDVNNLHVAL